MDNNLNQNNTNGTNMNMGGINSNPIPPQPPVTPPAQEPVNPVLPVTPEPMNPTPSVPEQATVGQTPMENIAMPTPPAANPAPQPSMNTTGNINLQPEGVVTPMPEAAPQTPAAPEPLMSTSLNENTNLNPNVNTGVPNSGGMTMNQPGFQSMGTIPNMNQDPMGINQVGMNPMNNSIDMMGVPTPPPLPSDDGKKRKKGNNKILLIVLIVVLIAGVGFGLYYVLVMSKNTTNTTVTVTPTLTELERGVAFEIVASNFATVSNYDINTCTVDTDLDIQTVGTYQYTVTCGTATASQTVTVTDNNAPFVTVKEVIVTPNEEVFADDFVYGTDEDISNCTFEFVNPVDTSTPGTYEVAILASDAYENETEITATLVVDENAPQTFLYCTPADTTNTANSTTENSYRFGIDAAGNLYNSKNITVFTYEDEASYSNAINEYKNTGSLNGTTGIASFDSYNLQISIMSDTDSTALATAFNLSVFPTTQMEIEALFPNGCDIGTN